MKNASLLSVLTLFLAITSTAQSAKKDQVGGDHFLLKGKVYELDMYEGTEKAAVTSQIVVYQEKEIFVAFFTKDNGLYEFYLPVGHSYEIWYGGSAFVNKKVSIDSRMMSKSKKPQTLVLDMGLFRPVDGQDFAILKEPYVQVTYEEEYGELVPDIEYTEARSAELEKIFRKLKKEQSKK